jgi:membrane protein implicated in regulation of membrane protease activity
MAPRRRRYAAGRPDLHNPLGGVGGAAPAYSPLTLRLVLAGFGLVVCVVGAVISFVVGVWTLGILMIVFAVIAVVDLAIISRRKRRGEPG